MFLVTKTNLAYSVAALGLFLTLPSIRRICKCMLTWILEQGYSVRLVHLSTQPNLTDIVIEPEGIVEIRMRKDKLVTLMERTDSTYAALKVASKDESSSAEERAAVSSELAKRESDLMPTYKQIAILYADLHECVSYYCNCSAIDTCL